MIVVMQPLWIPARTGDFVVVGIGIGPFGGQGPVEPLDLVTGLGPMRTCKHVLDLLGRKHGVEQLRPVLRAVVGRHPFDGGAVADEEGEGYLP